MVSAAESSVGDWRLVVACGIRRRRGGMKSDPDVEPDLVSTVDHVTCAKRVDTREIDTVFYAYVNVFAFFIWG